MTFPYASFLSSSSSRRKPGTSAFRAQSKALGPGFRRDDELVGSCGMNGVAA